MKIDVRNVHVTRGQSLRDGDELIVQAGATLVVDAPRVYLEIVIWVGTCARPAKEEVPGERILCFDHLGQGYYRREPDTRYIDLPKGAVVSWETIAGLARIGEALPAYKPGRGSI